jgi:CRP-like cAMP-binding protein
LQKGLVKIVTVNQEGNQKILDIHGPGRLFGEQAVDELPYFSTAIAAENSVIYFFSSETFQELVQTSPDFLALFVDSVVQKMQILSEGIILKAFTSEQHIAYTLSKVSQACQCNEIFLTQQDIAKLTGLTRITVYKILKKWKEDNLIDIRNRTIVIKEQEILRKML